MTIVVDRCAQQRHRQIRARLVKRADDLIAERQQLLIENQAVHDLRAGTGRSQAGNRGHVGEVANHIFVGDDDPGAGAGKPSLERLMQTMQLSFQSGLSSGRK